jgi:hypothetical protein
MTPSVAYITFLPVLWHAFEPLTPMKLQGRRIMNHKLRVLVSLDLDGGSARITVRGHVSSRSIQALYVVAKRANSIVPGLELLLDISEARVQPEALAQLQASSAAGRLPAAIDPSRAECLLTLLEPAPIAPSPAAMGLAA